MAVCEYAGSYNPLCIYGKAGLGKTHLLQAIANGMFSEDKNTNLIYVSAEKFTMELQSALEEGTHEKFKALYRNLDYLLIDDFGYLRNRLHTQQELVYTFNELILGNKQIVVASDRMPRKLPAFDIALKTQFGGGLVVDLYPPDMETRVAILREKAKREGKQMPDEVLSYIAENITKNVRELLGALIRVMEYASFHRKEITLQLAQDALKHILPV
jgi:chromosomal replication initiator protein